MGRGKPRTYLRKPGEVAVIRYTYEKLASEMSKQQYCNIHSQLAYQKGFMDAVDMYVKPKKRSEEAAKEDSMLQDIID